MDVLREWERNESHTRGTWWSKPDLALVFVREDTTPKINAITKPAKTSREP